MTVPMNPNTRFLFGVVLTPLGAALALLGCLLGCGNEPSGEENLAVKILSPSIAVDSDDWWLLKDEMEGHLQTSIERISDRHFADAADEIRMAAVFVRTEAGRAKTRYQDRLLSLAEDLERASDKVESASEVRVETLTDLFAEANFLVSQNHLARAEKAYQENNALALGRAMIRSVEGLERAYHWTGEKVSETSRSAIDRTKALANEFLTQSRMVKDSVTTPLQPVNQEFERFGENIRYKDPKREFTDLVMPKPTPTP